MSIETIARSSKTSLVTAKDDNLVSEIWFKTDPLDRHFIYRAIQLQLQTQSCDHGHAATKNAGCWSWFELVIFKNKDATEPEVKDGKVLAWRSHANSMDKKAIASYFGMVFDRRHELLDTLELGNVIGVRVCAQYPGWVNEANEGRLVAKILDEEIFTPMSWTLNSKEISDDIPTTIEDGVYSLIPTTSCHVKSDGDEQADSIWFSTPVFDEDAVAKIEDIQLITQAHHEGTPAENAVGIWCWFDLVILDNAEATQPRVEGGRALVWRSHDIPKGAGDKDEQTGKLFGRDHEMFGLLKVGNVIAVRACARFPGWELDAHYARLVVRISNKGPRRPAKKVEVDWKKYIMANDALRKSLETYLDDSTPKTDPAALSVETTLLAQELRSDRLYGLGGAPLRLLSLDGGGVRGIAALQVLKAVMGKITGDPNAKPCDYFDMMCGTSTGGLIAIMLGRLRMSIDDTITAYNALAGEIFGAGTMSKIGNASSSGARYSGEALEKAIKKVVTKFSDIKNPEAPMLDPLGKDGCPVFVCSTRADDISNRVATHLRTYINQNVEKSFADYKIWEAARATSAAPTYFPRIVLDGFEYVDGGLGFNNPVLLLMGEARLHFGFARPLGCLVTIGTGMAPNVALPKEGTNILNSAGSALVTVERMWELTTKGEHANLMAQPLCEKGTYYRFNVGQKIPEKRWVETVNPSLFKKWFGGETPQQIEHFTAENWADIMIDLADYKRMDEFSNLTLKYMETEDNRAKECSGKLPPRRPTVAVGPKS